jgi:hypothetical protein
VKWGKLLLAYVAFWFIFKRIVFWFFHIFLWSFTSFCSFIVFLMSFTYIIFNIFLWSFTSFLPSLLVFTSSKSSSLIDLWTPCGLSAKCYLWICECIECIWHFLYGFVACVPVTHSSILTLSCIPHTWIEILSPHDLPHLQTPFPTGSHHPQNHHRSLGSPQLINSEFTKIVLSSF